MNTPLNPNQLYTQAEDGTFTPINDQTTTVAPVAQDDLPPDLRNPATPKIPEPETQSSIDATKVVEEIRQKIEDATSKVAAEKSAAANRITDQDRKEFLKNLLTGKSYRKQYPLFGGKMQVTFKTITTAESEAITEAIVIQSNRVPFSNSFAIGVAHMKYSLTCCLDQILSETEEGITIREFKSPLTAYPDTPKQESYYVKEAGNLTKKTGMLAGAPGQKVLWAAVDNFTDIEIPIYNLLFTLFQKFDADVLQLASEAADPNFFQAGVDGR